MNIFSNSKYLHNENGKICNVLGEKYILVGLEGLHTLVFLTSEVSYLFSSNGSPNRIAEPASSSWVLQDRNETFEWNNSLETISFVWKNGTPVLLEDLEEGVPVNFDAIFRNGLGYLAILVWIGSKPKSSPVPKENELMFVKEFVHMPVHCISYKRGQPTAYVSIEDSVKEIAFTHHVANVDGKRVSSFEELENTCQNDKPAVATICKFIKMDRHNYIYIFVCSGLYVGNEPCYNKTSMKSNFNCHSLYTSCHNQTVSAAGNTATLHYDIDFHISNNICCKHMVFQLNGKFIVIEKHEILNFTKNYDVPYLGGTFHVYHEFKRKDVYNFLVFKTFPNQETLKDCVIDNKLNTVRNRDKNSGANELYLISCSFIQNRIELDSHERCSPSLKIQPDSNAESALSRSLASIDLASELTLQLPYSISNSTIVSLPPNAGRAVGYADEEFSLHNFIKYENSPTNGASSQEQHKHNTEALDPVFQIGRLSMGDLADSMPNASKEKTFYFDLKNEQCSMPSDSKMLKNSPQNYLSLANSGVNWHVEKLDSDKPAHIKSEIHVNSQMQHNKHLVDIPSQSDVTLSKSNSGKDKKEQLILDCPQHPNSHQNHNSEKIKLFLENCPYQNEPNNSKPNCDLPNCDNEFMSFLLEYVNILDSLTINEFYSFMNSHKTTNTSFPCLRKLQGRVYYNEKLKQYFLLGKSPFGICLFQILDLFTSFYFDKKFVFPSSNKVFNEKTVFFDAVLVNNQYISVLIYDKDPDVGTMISSDYASLYYNIIGIYKGVDSTNEMKFDIFMNNFSTSISGNPRFIEDSSKKKAKGLDFLMNDYVLLHLSSLVTTFYNKWAILFVVPLKSSSSENIKLSEVSKRMKKKLTQLKQTYGISPSTGINAHYGSYSDASKFNLIIPKSEIEAVLYSETKENKLTLAKSNRELPIPDSSVNLEPNIVNLDSGISESQLFDTNNLGCKFDTKSNVVLSLPKCNQEYILATASNGHKPTSEYLNSTLQPNATLFSDENETLFNGKLNKKEVTEALKDSEPCVEKKIFRPSKTNIKFNTDVEFRTGFRNRSSGCSGGSGVLLEREERVEPNDSLENLDDKDCRQTSLCSRFSQVGGIYSQNIFNSKKMPSPLIKKDNTITSFELGAAVPSATGRLQYERDFLLQLQQCPLSLMRPDSLPNLEAVLDGPHQRSYEHLHPKRMEDFKPSFLPGPNWELFGPLPNYYDLMMLGLKKNQRPAASKVKDIKLSSSSKNKLKPTKKVQKTSTNVQSNKCCAFSIATSLLE